ncbi:hypothetical protein C8R46DRAFT_304642 [Mycena filopes]|nr:hypothetical protein C8R46DRAFT_304642 [Mycena filopes]
MFSTTVTHRTAGAGVGALRSLSAWAASAWDTIPAGPSPDPILGVSEQVSEAFMADNLKDPRKINLSVGAYRDSQGKPYVLDCVKNATAEIESFLEAASNPTRNRIIFNP